MRSRKYVVLGNPHCAFYPCTTFYPHSYLFENTRCCNSFEFMHNTSHIRGGYLDSKASVFRVCWILSHSSLLFTLSDKCFPNNRVLVLWFYHLAYLLDLVKKEEDLSLQHFKFVCIFLSSKGFRIFLYRACRKKRIKVGRKKGSKKEYKSQETENQGAFFDS